MMNKIGLLVALVAACTTSVTPSTEDVCSRACAAMESLECPEAETKEGASCVLWCRRYHGPGYMPPWADCVAKAETVEAVRACGMMCKR